MRAFTIRRTSPYLQPRDIYCLRSHGQKRNNTGYPAAFTLKVRVGGSPYRKEMAKIFGEETAEKLAVSDIVNGVVAFENEVVADEFSDRLVDHPDIFLWPSEVIAIDSHEFFRVVSDSKNGSVAVLVSTAATGVCPVAPRNELLDVTHECDFIN